jgi:hypothetical protein
MKSSYEKIEKEDFEKIKIKNGKESILYRHDIDTVLMPQV